MELFRLQRLHQAGAAAGADERAQKAAAWDVLATLFSPAGLSKAKNVMTLQDVLAASGNGSGQRSSERFSVSVFGTPAETGAWGLRLEGHHLTQSVAVRDGRIVSVTPSSFSAYPNRVGSGPHAGLEHAQGRGGAGAAADRRSRPELQARARQSDGALGNILSSAGRERANAQKVGLAAAELTAAQRDLVWQLVETYAVEHLPPTVATAQRRACGPATVRPCISPGTARTRRSRRSATA